MKQFVKIIILSCFLLPAVCPQAAGLTLITEEFPPFNFSRDGTATGATTQIVREIARRLQIDDAIEIMPWARGYERLCNEPDVVLFTTARTPERDPLFHWVGPLYVFRLGFYARKDSGLRIQSLEAAKEVAAIATYKNDFREQILQSLGFTNLDSSNSPKSGIRKLMSGRVDLWFFDNVGASRMALEAGFDPAQLEEVFVYQQHFSYIAISKQTSAAIVRQWQRTLDEMKADGTFRWLASKWLPSKALMVSQPGDGGGKPFSLKLYTENSPPSSYKQDGGLKGLSVEIVKEILKRIGRSDTISLVTWARGYQLSLADKDTALFATTRLPQRENLFHWVGPLYRQQWGFYRWKGSGIDVANMEAAKKVMRIGTYRQDAKMQYLKGLGFTNLVSTSRNINNLEHLKHGDIDLWVSSDFNMPHLVRQAGLTPEHVELAFGFHKVGNYIAFSKSTSPHIVRLWQAVLDEMKSDGSYLKICRKYGYAP